jgi:hypothetical protein
MNSLRFKFTCLIVSAYCLSSMDLFSQSIEVDVAFGHRSQDRIKNNYRRANKTGSGIRVSVADLQALLSQSADDSVTFFIVAMDKNDRTVWSRLNTGTPESDWEHNPGLIMKADLTSPTKQQVADHAGFYHPLALIWGHFATAPYYTTKYLALGKLCPPPIDCTIR